MISGENLFSNLLTITILLVLAIIVYAKMAKKTLVDIIVDIRSGFSDKSEEVYDTIPHSFQDIR